MLKTIYENTTAKYNQHKTLLTQKVKTNEKK